MSDIDNNPQPKVALVTGAGSGIGKATALRFARAGYRVLICDLDENAAAATCQQACNSGAEAEIKLTDVSSLDSCIEMAAAALDKWGRIDVLVANAGVQIAGSLLEFSEADWDKIIGINLKGAAYSCRAVLPAMLQQQSGAIVIISSTNAVRGKAGMAVYDMSKAGVLGLTRNLAAEHGGQGVRVNAVCPGDTLTEFHINKLAQQGIDVDGIRRMTSGYGLLGRIAEPVEIANAVHFLASDEASFITGQTLCVDGGFTVTGGGK